MKRITNTPFTLAFLLAAAPLASQATTFFTDNFSNGSTLNAASVPGGISTASKTSYDVASTKAATSCAIVPNDLTLKITTTTTSGGVELQALFTTNAVALTASNDYIEFTVVFTNTSGTLLAGGTASALWMGLFNSGGFAPVAGGLNSSGLNGTASSAFATNNCANWKGYVGQITSNGTSRIVTRPLQNGAGTTSANQDLLGNNAGTGFYVNPAGAVLVAGAVQGITLTSGSQYTLLERITLSDTNTLTISNALFAGAGTGGTMLYSQSTNNVTNANFITASFDGLGIGVFNKGTSFIPTMDISSILITGVSTPVSTPPVITTQPVPVSVASGASCVYTVAATGFGLTYQWHRNGTNLINGGNISGATTATLVISPATAADVASGGNGYYVTVSGTGGFSVDSTTNALSLRTASALTWSGTSTVWDLATTASFVGPTVFNYGDSVTFDDTGLANPLVNIANNFLSVSAVTVNSAGDYSFGGTGSISGNGSLSYIGSGHLTMSNANSYTGGTTISNASAFLVLNNYGALGTGPVNLAAAGGNMEIVPSGAATVGINGNINVLDDFTITYDAANSTFGAVFLGDFSGTVGKTLTINHTTGTNFSRIRVYGTNTTYNANLNLTGALTSWAPYNSSGKQIYNGVISGAALYIHRGNGTSILNGQNTYSGGTTPTTGMIGFGADTIGSTPDSGPIGVGPLLLAPEVGNTGATGGVFASGGARTIANPIQYPSITNNLTLLVGGTNDLTFTGAMTLNGNDASGATNRILQVTNTGLTSINGVISDGGNACGLIKTGNGVLALNNAETYTGPTIVSNGGTLQINGSIGTAAVTVATNGILGGTGTVGGAVTVQNGGGIAPGAGGVGTLTVNNSVTFATGSTCYVEVNKLAGTRDQLVGVSTLTYAGTLNATNLAGTPNIGDTFQIFTATTKLGNFSSITGSPGAGKAWAFNPTSGVLSVIQGVNLTPTNIVSSLDGLGNLVLQWPADHIGWRLLAQTNGINVGVSNNWVAVAGSTTTNLVKFNINQANATVFFKLAFGTNAP